MNNRKGFTLVTALLVVLGLVVLGGAGYAVMNPQVFQQQTSETVQEIDDATKSVGGDTKSSIVWRFESAGEIDAIPYTAVTVVINGTAYGMGKFTGSCSEIGASGGVDGTGLLAGELSAAQCWFAGGGNEIGVFAHEDGGFDIMVGELSEGDAETPLFRGDFNVKTSIEL